VLNGPGADGTKVGGEVWAKITVFIEGPLDSFFRFRVTSSKPTKTAVSDAKPYPRDQIYRTSA
jgi:hypothetical protein